MVPPCGGACPLDSTPMRKYGGATGGFFPRTGGRERWSMQRMTGQCCIWFRSEDAPQWFALYALRQLSTRRGKGACGSSQNALLQSTLRYCRRRATQTTGQVLGCPTQRMQIDGKGESQSTPGRRRTLHKSQCSIWYPAIPKKAHKQSIIFQSNINIKIQHTITCTHTDTPFLVMVETHKFGGNIYA